MADVCCPDGLQKAHAHRNSPVCARGPAGEETVTAPKPMISCWARCASFFLRALRSLAVTRSSSAGLVPGASRWLGPSAMTSQNHGVCHHQEPSPDSDRHPPQSRQGTTILSRTPYAMLDPWLRHCMRPRLPSLQPHKCLDAPP